MKEIVVHAELPLSPERVFELLYSGKEFYRKFHLDIDGDDCADIGDWEGNIRVGRFTTPLNAPALITSIIKTSVLRIQEKQIRTYHPDGSISVRSEPVVDIPGAERFPSTATVTYSPPPKDGDSYPPCRVEVIVTTACVGIWGLQGTIESMMVEKAHSSIQVWLDYTEKACAEEAQRIDFESQSEPEPLPKPLSEPEAVPEAVKAPAAIAEVIEDQEGDRFYDAEAEVDSDAAAADKRRKQEIYDSEDTPDAKLRRMLEEGGVSQEAPAGASAPLSLQPPDTKDSSNANALVVVDKRAMDTFHRDVDSLMLSQDDSREAIKALARQLSSIERQLQSVRKALPEGGDISHTGHQNGYHHHGRYDDFDCGASQDLALRSSRVSLPVAMAGAGIVGAVCGSLAVLGFIFVRSRSQSR